MRKTIYFLLAFAMLMVSCSNEKTNFTLKGEISGLASDTLLVYYQVPECKLDTIFCQKGLFEYSFEPDTTTMFSLIFNANESLVSSSIKSAIAKDSTMAAKAANDREFAKFASALK